MVQLTDWGPFDLFGKDAVVTEARWGSATGSWPDSWRPRVNVVVADLDGEAAAAAAKDTAGRGRAVAMAVDVGADDAGEAMVSACVGAFGSIDVLVNNAGIYPMSPTTSRCGGWTSPTTSPRSRCSWPRAPPT